MKKITNISASTRKESFFKSLNLSIATIGNYTTALNSKYLKEYLNEHYNVADIFEITDLNVLWEIYSEINIAPKNIANHRGYSAAIMKYIRFLNNGNKIGKRRDYNSKRMQEG